MLNILFDVFSITMPWSVRWDMRRVLFVLAQSTCTDCVIIDYNRCMIIRNFFRAASKCKSGGGGGVGILEINPISFARKITCIAITFSTRRDPSRRFVCYFCRIIKKNKPKMACGGNVQDIFCLCGRYWFVQPTTSLAVGFRPWLFSIIRCNYYDCRYFDTKH